MANRTEQATIILKGHTANILRLNNPILWKQELQVESDTFKCKIGDGVTHWNDLPYCGTLSTELADATHDGLMSKEIYNRLTSAADEIENLEIPLATNEKAGIVMIGENLAIDSNGVLSALKGLTIIDETETKTYEANKDVAIFNNQIWLCISTHTSATFIKDNWVSLSGKGGSLWKLDLENKRLIPKTMDEIGVLDLADDEETLKSLVEKYCKIFGGSLWKYDFETGTHIPKTMDEIVLGDIAMDKETVEAMVRHYCDMYGPGYFIYDNNTKSVRLKTAAELNETATSGIREQNTAMMKACVEDFVNDYVIESSHDTMTGTFYRKYKSGRIVQGGIISNVSNNTIVTLSSPYTTNNYHISTNVQFSVQPDMIETVPALALYDVTNTEFRIKGTGINNMRVGWMTDGY